MADPLARLLWFLALKQQSDLVGTGTLWSVITLLMTTAVLSLKVQEALQAFCMVFQVV